MFSTSPTRQKCLKSSSQKTMTRFSQIANTMTADDLACVLYTDDTEMMQVARASTVRWWELILPEYPSTSTIRDLLSLIILLDWPVASTWSDEATLDTWWLTALVGRDKGTKVLDRNPKRGKHWPRGVNKRPGLVLSLDAWSHTLLCGTAPVTTDN